MNNRPIGVFDSGLGGLTVLKQLKLLLPNENFVYLGDTARVPYGTRSKETVVRFAKEDTQFLIDKRVKLIVIACNTASAYALENISNYVDIPVFGVIDGAVKSAVEVSQTKRIAVIGTRGTISSGAYQRSLKEECHNCEVITKSCPLFVPLIEEGETSGQLISLTAQKYLGELCKKDFDVLIMGCTHYPIISEIIKNELKKDLILIDPGVETAKIVRRYLEENEILSIHQNSFVEYYLTDLSPDFNIVAENFLGEKLEKVNQIKLE